jgi:ERCC4-type nuclease
MEVMILVSPTEPEKIKQLGKVSPIPEQYGADVLFSARGQLVGVQRKAFDDFLASLFDGRLGKEITQMKRLNIAVLVIEGRPRWTLDGELIDDNRRITRNQLRSLLWTIAIGHNVAVEWTDSIDDTVNTITNLRAWAAKKKHLSVARRPGPSGPWGKATTKDWAVHFLQGLPHIGPELAERIYDTFKGVPMRWAVGKKELTRVPGIGKQKAKVLWEILGGELK